MDGYHVSYSFSWRYRSNKSNCWRSHASENSSFAGFDKLLTSTAYASALPVAGKPIRLTTPITNSSSIGTNDIFSSKYFVDIGNDNGLDGA